MFKIFSQTKSFLNNGIWFIGENEVSKGKYRLYTILKIVLITLQTFRKKEIQLKASALTLYSLLAVVPILAMALGISKGFGLDEFLQSELTKHLRGQEEVLNYLLSFADKFLESINGGIIAGIGVVILLWSVFSILNNIELSFNKIWSIPKDRTYLRKFTDYFSFMFVAPVLIILSSGMTVIVSDIINKIGENVNIFLLISPFFLKLIPYAIMWLLFWLTYLIIPNTKVTIKSALIAGIIAGTAFQLLQWAYIEFQFGVSRYNAIYGSFAALPLFIIWLQFSWHIVLYGAAISYGIHSVDNWEYEADNTDLSYHEIKKLSLIILNKILIHYKEGEPPYTSSELSKQLNVPGNYINKCINMFIESNILCRIDKNGKMAFIPSKDITNHTISDILLLIENSGKGYLGIKSKEAENVEKILNSIEEKFNLGEDNISICKL